MGGGGDGFVMGTGEFLKSLYIVGRGVLTPLFYEDSLYCLPPFSNFVLFDMLFYLMIIWIYSSRASVP